MPDADNDDDLSIDPVTQNIGSRSKGEIQLSTVCSIVERFTSLREISQKGDAIQHRLRHTG
jgi:hypothetical protein